MSDSNKKDDIAIKSKSKNEEDKSDPTPEEEDKAKDKETIIEEIKGYESQVNDLDVIDASDSVAADAPVPWSE